MHHADCKSSSWNTLDSKTRSRHLILQHAAAIAFTVLYELIFSRRTSRRILRRPSSQMLGSILEDVVTETSIHVQIHVCLQSEANCQNFTTHPCWNGTEHHVTQNNSGTYVAVPALPDRSSIGIPSSRRSSFHSLYAPCVILTISFEVMSQACVSSLATEAMILPITQGL